MRHASKSLEVPASFAEWTGREYRIIRIEFDIEDENDAIKVAKDQALLGGSELIYLSWC